MAAPSTAPTSPTLGTSLRALRHLAGVSSLDELATMTGISAKRLWRIENDRFVPEPHELTVVVRKLERRARIDLKQWFLSGKEPRRSRRRP